MINLPEAVASLLGNVYDSGSAQTILAIGAGDVQPVEESRDSRLLGDALPSVPEQSGALQLPQAWTDAQATLEAGHDGLFGFGMEVEAPEAQVDLPSRSPSLAHTLRKPLPLRCSSSKESGPDVPDF